MTLTVYDEFAGWGGSSQGALAIPGVEVMLAANHNPLAVEVHQLNFPRVDHYCGDIAKAEIEKFPRADLFWASPVCPPWSNDRGKRRDFDRSTQTLLFDGKPDPRAEQVQRSRALMEEVPRYLRAMARRGKPVLAGVVENVVEVRHWAEWRRWLQEIRLAGPYKVRVIALNSMHARPVRTLRAPQSRDRAYVAYWLDKKGIDPDWDKWLRPRAYCPSCDETVLALQVFKNPRNDMGRYGVRHGQYYYRCPNRSCRHEVVEPEVLPAAAAIDWTLDPGQKIGERVDKKGRPDPLEPATLTRIEKGLLRYGAQAMLSPAGGTWRNEARLLSVPMPARTTRESDGLFLPPLLVPTTGRENKNATTVARPLPTQTCRRETAVVVPPFIAILRGGGSKKTVDGINEPLATFSAKGTHHGLVVPPGGQLLVPYYSTGTARPVSEPIGALTTRDRYGLAGIPHDGELPAVEECTFRMIAPREIQRGMAFDPEYQVKGSKRDQVRGFGNAVTPPSSEVILSPPGGSPHRRRPGRLNSAGRSPDPARPWRSPSPGAVSRGCLPAAAPVDHHRNPTPACRTASTPPGVIPASTLRQMCESNARVLAGKEDS